MLDYIIIGSGIAGLHTAYRLNQQGKKILVLEKESYAGGRMSSHKIDGEFVDFGAKFVANAYKYMLPLAEELDVELVPIDLTKTGIIKEGRLNTFDGSKRFSAAVSYKGLSPGSKLRLALATLYALVKYRKLDIHDMETTAYLDDKSAYDDFRKMAGPEGFDHVLECFSCNVIFYSTKELSRGPFYSLLPKLIKLKTFSFPRGIGQLCEKMATQVPIDLNTEVKSVQRTPDGIVVKALQDGSNKTYQAKSAILAVPGNRVLDILDGPLPEEKEFFSQVSYASSVQVLCEGKTDFFKEANTILTLPSEDSSFASLGIEEQFEPSEGTIHFALTLREKVFRHLQKTNNLKPDSIRALIQKEFPNISDLKVICFKVWESATPRVYPGYVRSMVRFLNSAYDSGRVYFCGDYLENPSTEGALTSSIKLLQRLK